MEGKSSICLSSLCQIVWLPQFLPLTPWTPSTAFRFRPQRRARPRPSSGAPARIFLSQSSSAPVVSIPLLGNPDFGSLQHWSSASCSPLSPDPNLALWSSQLLPRDVVGFWSEEAVFLSSCHLLCLAGSALSASTFLP